MGLGFFSHSEILAPFFFLIGLQLRNEISHLKEIFLPTFAAIGGMLFPALIFIAINPDPVISVGWPLVMPTDIALVILVLLALGKRASLALKTFLLALAVADDLLSIIVLGVKYTGALKPFEVLASFGAVLLGALVGKVPVEKLLTKFVNFVVLPIYVFANIYPTLTTDLQLQSQLGNSVILARVVGKIIGISLFALIAVKLFRSELKISKFELAGGAALAGMGLAVSIMIANLSYASENLLNQAKVGLLIAALVSAVIGSLILVIGPNRVRK
jgi:NhaA family Na+:H+ antiporter